jgi:hypothetical protein
LDAYVKFIEDDFLGGQRLDPNTDGRPDPRPSVRERASVLGDLSTEFDFTQAPRAPMLLPVHPTTTLAAIVPFPPITPSAAPGSGRATVQWARPLSDGGATITGYRITPSVDGTLLNGQTFNSTATSETVSALTNGRSYTFKIAAINAKGVGLPSISSTAIIVGAPLAPPSSAASPANGAARVTWTKPADNGTALTQYQVTPFLNGVEAQPPQFFGPDSTAQTVTGLGNGQTYTFTIAAENGWGYGPPNHETAPITVGAPGKPTAVTASAGQKSAVVHWTAPSANNG